MFEDTQVSFRGQFAVARAAISMRFVLQGEDPVEGLLARFFASVPEDRELFQLASATSHRMTRLAQRKKRGKYLHRIGDEPEFAVGEFAFELIPGQPTVTWALPVAWPANRLRALFEEAVTFAQPAHASCGYGFNLVWGREWEQCALPVLLRLGLAFPVVDVPCREFDQRSRDIRGPAWLTYLGATLCARVEGNGQPFGSGMMFSSGDTPHHALEPHATLAKTLRPIRANEWGFARSLLEMTHFAGVLTGYEMPIADVNADSWFSRLD